VGLSPGSGVGTMSYKLEVIKVKASFGWAIKATMFGKVRYRGYRIKSEAIRHLQEFDGKEPIHFERDFNHNFNSATELGIKW